MKSWKSHRVFVSCISFFTGGNGPKIMCRVSPRVIMMVPRNGPVYVLACHRPRSGGRSWRLTILLYGLSERPPGVEDKPRKDVVEAGD